MILPQPLYELIRWLIAVLLPAIAVFFSTLAEAWGWNLPTQAILTTIAAIELFLGSIFGISKISFDNSFAEYLKTPEDKDKSRKS